MNKIKFEPGTINEKYKNLDRTITEKDLDVFIKKIDRFRISGENYVDLPTFDLHILNKEEIEIYYIGDKVIEYDENDLDSLYSYAKTIKYNEIVEEEVNDELVFLTNTFEENYKNLSILKARLVKKYNDDIISDDSLEKMAKKYTEIRIPDLVGSGILYYSANIAETIGDIRDKEQIIINEKYRIYFREYTIRRYYDLSNIDSLKKLNTNLKYSIIHLGDKINAYSQTEDGEVYICSCKKKAIENKIKLYTRLKKDFDGEAFIEKLIDELGLSFYVSAELVLSCEDPDKWVNLINFKDKCCHSCNKLNKDENQIAKESTVMLDPYYATYLNAEELNDYAQFMYYENKFNQYLIERGLGVFDDGGVYFDDTVLEIDPVIKDTLDVKKLLKILESMTDKEKAVLEEKLEKQDKSEVIAYVYNRKVLNRKSFDGDKFIEKAEITEKEDEGIKSLKTILLGNLRLRFVEEVLDILGTYEVKPSQKIHSIIINNGDRGLILSFDKFKTITIVGIENEEVKYHKDEIIKLKKYLKLEEILKEENNMPSISKYKYEDVQIMYYNLEEENIEKTNKKIDDILDYISDLGICSEIIEWVME